MGRDGKALLQGTLDVLVLQALKGRSLHGYDVARWIRDASGGAFVVEDGALYTSLHRLQKRGLLASEWGTSESNRRAKFYGLSPAGQAELAAQTASWNAYADAVARVLASG